ncbi:MAG: hypothetical protein JW841_04120 [Deltaproteobacteria bacterium]|nr:hypothetical protein [Deltaproteobacteria bacterium]
MRQSAHTADHRRLPDVVFIELLGTFLEIVVVLLLNIFSPYAIDTGPNDRGAD